MSSEVSNDNIAPHTVLSVSQLNIQVKRLIEASFANVWVEGEISNLSMPASGHWYFSLKDSRATVRCAMFKGQNRLASFAPENGMQIVILAEASIYQVRGEFQLIVQRMEDAGKGLLQRAFEQLKQKLLNEGLFATDKKQKLPRFPKHIGVVTSPSGAVIQDICSVLKRRCPLIELTVLPVTVQGKEAANQISNMLKTAQRSCWFDALIIARGGGSLEDLQPFNDESVARAIADCTIPIVSSIGHETDTTIADYVADSRAPTPSAAAELLSPDQNEWLALLKYQQQKLSRLISDKLMSFEDNLNHLRMRLRHPQDTLREQSQRLDYISSQLSNLIQQQLMYYRLLIQNISQRINMYSPEVLMSHASLRLSHNTERLKQVISHLINNHQKKLMALSCHLNAYSPLKTLERGFSIAKTKDGEVLTQSRQVKDNDKVKLILHKGYVECTVDKVGI